MRVGLDVGGTTVKIGYFDNKKLIKKYEIKTTKDTLFTDIYNAIKDEKNIEAIGFGLPGHVSNNFIDFLPNVGIKNVDINEVFGKYFKGVKISSTNDANRAALGEAIYDGKYKSSYFITLGTGVGGGYIYNGKIVNGSHDNCGEIGHMFVDPIHNYKCTCGLTGCLETVTSATGVVRLAKEYKGKYKTSLSFDNLTAKDVFDKAKENDELALKVVKEMAMYLGIALADIAVTCDVEAFYIGGGVSKAGDILINAIKEEYVKHAHYAVKDVPVLLAKLGNDAGMLGAAYLDE